jgi:hypothetical protein
VSEVVLNPEAEGRRRGWLASVTELFAQVFSAREIISPGRYCAYNAFAGVILLAAAILVGIEPGLGTATGAGALGSVAVVMLSAIPVALFRPLAVPALLVLQGSLFILLGLALAADSVRWALFAPPFRPFRYAPGLALVMVTYGALQTAGFGPWAGRARSLRIAGLIAGILCELLVGGALAIRAFRS